VTVVPVSLKRNREFMLLWSGQALSGLGSQISQVAYPLLVLAVTGSPAKAGIVGFAQQVPIAVLALPAGALADHLNRKRLMIAATRSVESRWRRSRSRWPPARCRSG